MRGMDEQTSRTEAYSTISLLTLDLGTIAKNGETVLYVRRAGGHAFRRRRTKSVVDVSRIEIETNSQIYSVDFCRCAPKLFGGFWADGGSRHFVARVKLRLKNERNRTEQ